MNATNSDSSEVKVFWTNFFCTFLKCVHKICNVCRIVSPYCCIVTFLGGPDIIIVNVFFSVIWQVLGCDIFWSIES